MRMHGQALPPRSRYAQAETRGVPSPIAREGAIVLAPGRAFRRALRHDLDHQHRCGTRLARPDSNGRQNGRASTAYDLLAVSPLAFVMRSDELQPRAEGAYADA